MTEWREMDARALLQAGIVEHCKRAAFRPLLEAFNLFMPGSALALFLFLIQVFGRLSGPLQLCQLCSIFMC